MEYLLLTIVILITLVGFKQVKKESDWFNPIFIFIVPILLSNIINLAYYNQRFKISSETYLIYLFSVLAVSIGVFGGMNAKVRIRLANKSEGNRNIYRLLWLFSIFCSFFAIQQILQGYRSGIFGDNFINNVRYYTSYVSESGFFAEYGIVTTDALMIYLLYRYFVKRDDSKSNRISLIISIMLYMLYTAMQFNRTNILYLVSVIGFFFTKKNSGILKKNKKTILGVAVLIIVMLIVFNYIAVKTDKYLMSFSGESWWIYYFGSEFYWLDLFSTKADIHTYGVSSLGMLGRLLYKIGLIPNVGLIDYRSLKQAYGSPVSSFVSSPFLDFEYFGIIILIIYGFLIGYIYKSHIIKGGIWTMYYSTCVYQLVIAFYAFQFGLSSQIYVFVILFLLLNGGIRTHNGYKSKVQ